ncbi:hypothetical protein [Devosia aurantiaca]|uniref:Uncharacterized protein n=1 Tax=Devosia aurantiaca TaxID=2714858 RepID=A0A6M1SHI8_9HYPH|nr:hypothetical protein [Devosia aurantiaca]NGP18927.1 hypothetical protein [Devosia aurantiaca]
MIIMEPTWLTVLWVGAMAFCFGVAVERIRKGMKMVKADAERRSQINITLNPGHRYSRNDVCSPIERLADGIDPKGGAR